MAAERAPWRPDWAVPPGEILAEALEERAMSQSELARRMDRPIKTINEIVNGKAAITPETAIQLERSLGITAGFWIGLEAEYRKQLAWQRAVEELEAHAAWADAFPISALERHDLIQRGTTKGATVAALLSFFRVSSPQGWEKQWLQPPAAYRASPAFAAAPHAVAAWLRWGEQLAAERQTDPFNEEAFRQVLKEIRSLTRRDVALTIDRVKELCASAGVALVITPELPGTRLSGAARWLSHDKALIQLSARHKTDDHFWFSFFHEAGHLVTRKREDFVDAAGDRLDGPTDAESEADRFARDLFIPPGEYAAFIAHGKFTHEAVRTFARKQGIAPGIVVGRLQRDGHLPPSHLNRLKKRVEVSSG